MPTKNTRQLYKNGFGTDKVCYLDDGQTARLKKILVGMLADFMEFAEKHDIRFTLSGGSVLGAVRHQGFIPWDDDIDLNITRKEYNRLLDIFENDSAMTEKYVLCSPERTPGHGMLCAQIKKKGTIYRSFNELGKPDGQSGICMDIFIIENTPDNALIRKLRGCMALVRGYVSTCRKTYEDISLLENYLEEGTPIERAFKKKSRVGKLFSRKPLDLATKTAAKCYAHCKNDNSKYVTIPSGRRHYFGEMHLRSDLCETQEAMFEGLSVNIPKGWDAYLTSLYGADYMQLPPVEKREKHPLMAVDLGEWE